jgi:hypothetical protein
MVNGTSSSTTASSWGRHLCVALALPVLSQVSTLIRFDISLLVVRPASCRIKCSTSIAIVHDLFCIFKMAPLAPAGGRAALFGLFSLGFVGHVDR